MKSVVHTREVLIVEDDGDIREALQAVLADEGYKALAVANGREALHVLTQRRPALILLDLMMPVMDGWTFRAEQTRDDELIRIPVVVLSADTELAQKTRNLDAAGYLKKPVDLDLLLSTVARWAGAPA